MNYLVLPPEINSLRMFSGAGSARGVPDAASTQAAGAAAQAKAVASAFEAAQSATVHPLAVSANRNQFVRLVVSNLFGQNAPAIAAAEGQYEEFWAQDVVAMVSYHGGASAAAGALAPWQQALQSLPGLPAQLAAATPSALGLPPLNTDLGNIGNSTSAAAMPAPSTWAAETSAA